MLILSLEKIAEKKIPFVETIQAEKPYVISDKFKHSDISEIWVGPSCNTSLPISLRCGTMEM